MLAEEIIKEFQHICLQRKQLMSY